MLTNEKLKRHLANFPVRPDIKVAVISGPTAIGKHTIVSRLEKTHRFLVPTTTRPPLRDEVNGINYYFVTKTDFVRAVSYTHLDVYKRQGYDASTLRRVMVTTKECPLCRQKK